MIYPNVLDGVTDTPGDVSYHDKPNGYTRVTFSVRSHTSHAIAVTLYCGQCKQGIHAGEPTYLESPAKGMVYVRAGYLVTGWEEIHWCRKCASKKAAQKAGRCPKRSDAKACSSACRQKAYRLAVSRRETFP